MFDGRNNAQNGWFVLRTLIPAGKTGDVVVWHIHANVIPGWTSQPVVSYNQVGYTPERPNIAVLELDPLFNAPKTARVVRLTPDGEYREVLSSAIKPWGKWMRHRYAHFDFSALREPGIYAIEYAGQRTGLFRIARIFMMESGARRSIHICRSRWTTSKCVKDIGFGVGRRTSMTHARRLSTTPTSTVINRALQRTLLFLPDSISLGSTQADGSTRATLTCGPRLRLASSPIWC